MAKVEGNLIINANDYSEELKEKIKNTPFEVDGVTL